MLYFSYFINNQENTPLDIWRSISDQFNTNRLAMQLIIALITGLNTALLR